MTSSNFLGKSVALIITVTIVVFGEQKNTPAQVLEMEQRPTALSRNFLLPSIPTKEESFAHQSVVQAIIPFNQVSPPPVLASISGGAVRRLGIFLIGGIILAAGGMILVAGRVVIKENEVGIVVKKFSLLPSAPRLAANRQFALKGEAGIQAQTLQTGQYWTYWPRMYDILKVAVTQIGSEQIGLVEAMDGETLPAGQNFGKVINCDNFQDERAFFEQKGQKGKQQAILTTGTYRINTKLFHVKKAALTEITADEVGLVEAKDGKPLPPERTFGRVTNCQDFQDCKAFFEQGGQAGKQMAILTTGTYQINTEIFSIRKEKLVVISPEEIGLVEALDGDPLSQGQTFGKIVECEQFRNASEFFRKGGQRGKQLAILTAGTHRINTDLFKIGKTSVTKIPIGHIGLVEAKDGKSLPPGHAFGKVVDCNDFEDGEAFLVNGGQAGKQLGYLRAGTYYINTELFQIRPVPVVEIGKEEIGLVEAKDGKPLPLGQNFAKAVECNSFQDGQAFLENGGQSGKQLVTLTAGTYQINTELFEIRKVPLTKIAPDEIGLVEAKDGKPLPLGKAFATMVECNDFQHGQAFLESGGQMGKQLAILKEGTYQINRELFNVRKIPVIHIDPGEIGLVEAKEGASMPPGRILAKVVDCDNFQNSEAFLKNGGQKGKQLAILTAGNYYINTDLFTVITTANAKNHGMNPDDLRVYRVDSDHVGIVTTLDGTPLPDGKTAAPVLEGHKKFQDGQKFIEAGGYRGLQEDVITEGEWNLNPWFVDIEQVLQTVIGSDEVGVVVSYVGKDSEFDLDTHNEGLNDDSDQSDTFFKLVEPGYMGVERIPLTAGKYPINTRVKRVELVPTHDIILNWTDELKPDTNYDHDLKALKLRSSDHYTFRVEFTQVLKIAPQDAPKMIRRIGAEAIIDDLNPNFNDSSKTQKRYGAIKNLVTRALAKMVSAYFQTSAQECEALEFANKHSERQASAEKHITKALFQYRVQGCGTYITDIVLDKDLEAPKQKLTQAKLEREAIKQDLETEVERRRLVEQQEETITRAEIIAEERKIEISRMTAEEQAEAERLANETLRQRLDIEADQKQRLSDIEINAFRQKVTDLSPELYAQLEQTGAWAEAFGKLKINYPQYFSSGGNSSSGGMDTLFQFSQIGLLKMFQEQLGQQTPRQLPSSQPPEQIGGALLEQESLPPQTTRCLVVLLLDTSDSMSNEYLNELIKGIATFREKIEQDNNASRCVEVALISMGGSAQVIQDFTTVNNFSTPVLRADGTAAIGQGIELALNSLQNHQSLGEDQGIQFYRPWIFLITASNPSNNWQNAARRVSQAIENRQLNFFVVCIQGVDMNSLNQIAHRSAPPVMLEEGKFRQLFQWIAHALKQVAISGLGSSIKLPPISSWARTDGIFRQ